MVRTGSKPRSNDSGSRQPFWGRAVGSGGPRVGRRSVRFFDNSVVIRVASKRRLGRVPARGAADRRANSTRAFRVENWIVTLPSSSIRGGGQRSTQSSLVFGSRTGSGGQEQCGQATK